MSPTGILLVNLGSPASPAVADVRRFLREFLLDERVIDLPYWRRWLVVHCFILPFRPAASAAAYRQIWQPEGAPLLGFSRKLLAALQPRFAEPIALAMRYQQPSIAAGLQQLLDRRVQRILLVPLYPHYALSSYETVVVRVRELLAKLTPSLPLIVVPPFFEDPDYIDALAASAQPQLAAGFDHLLLSFHGLPERHLRKADPTGHHCLVRPDCCDTPSAAHPFCYRAQVLKTVKALAARLDLPPEKFSFAFQSRLGRDRWLQPYTDHELVRLARQGVRRLLVLCPAFVTDCLETLEEIGIRGRNRFQQAGGHELVPLPCLNDHPRWIQALETLVRRHLE